MRIPQLIVLSGNRRACNFLVAILVAALVSSLVADAALAQPGRRVQLSFSGTTSASADLIQDVMRNVMDIGEDDLDCPRPDAVVARVLPEGFQPLVRGPAPKGARKSMYEEWTISFCGKKVPFLLTFWTMEQGGTAFDLDYPFQELASADEGPARFQ